jgi:hypothetical protein
MNTTKLLGSVLYDPFRISTNTLHFKTKQMKNSISLGLVLAFVLISFSGLAQTPLLDSSTWTVSNGDAPGFPKYGAIVENKREMDDDPFGYQSIIWKGIPVTPNSSGGWQSDVISIENDKNYRFTVWMKKQNAFTGFEVFGAEAYDSNNNDSARKLNGNIATNPIFQSGDVPNLNKWYLYVGYIHKNSYNGTTNYGGVYDPETGSKVLNATDYKFSTNSVKVKHRAYYYQGENSNDVLSFFDPQIITVNDVSNDLSNINQLLNPPTSSSCPSNIKNTNDNIALTNHATSNSSLSITPIDDGGCGVLVANSEANSPWTKYSMDIDLAANGLNTGDELNISIEAKNETNGLAQFMIFRNGNNGDFLSDKIFSNANTSYETHQATIQIPTGTNLLTIWLHPNYGSNTPGSVNFKNLTITKVGDSSGGGDPPSGGGGSVWSTSGSNIHFSTGKVGIGTTNISGYELAVGGEIRAEEVRVDTGWADYVFADEYKLPTLEEVQKHIEKKGHLPNIPSASEVKANGIELGDMNRLLLEKIEELTLYIIQQQAELDSLKEKIQKAQK